MSVNKDRPALTLCATQGDTENVLEALTSQSIAGIYIIQHNRFHYVNQAFANIFGYESPTEIMHNIRPLDLVAEEFREDVAEHLKLRIEGDEHSHRYIFSAVRKDGVKLNIEVHGSRAIFEGEPAVVGLFLDVTDRVRMEADILTRDQQLEEQIETRTEELKQAISSLQDSESRYRALFSHAKVPMLLIDPANGSIVDANKAACEYYGYQQQQLINLRISDINQLPVDEVAAEMEKARLEKRDHFYFVHKLADGSLRDVEVHSGPLQIAEKNYLYSIIHDITDRCAAEAQLKELNRDFITLLENTTDFVYFKDQQSRFRFCSQTLANITGHTSWRDMVGKHDLEVFPADTARLYYEEELPVFQEGVALLNKTDPYYLETGEKGWVSTNKWPVFDEETRQVIGLIGISRDVTLQHNAEEELGIAASVFNNASEGILITDASNKIIDANQAFCRMSGYSREEIIDKSPGFLNSGHHNNEFFSDLWESLDATGNWQGEIWNRHKNGSLFACRTSISVSKDSNGKVTRYISLHADITDFLRHHEAVEHMAYYDALTELPNRVLLSDRMTQALALSDRTRTSLAICFIDLDFFKPVNDLYGHKAGDLLLIEIARRLKRCVRGEDTLARLGGDEFALVLTQLTHEEELMQVINRILASISQPYIVPQGEPVTVSASIGICLYPQYKGSGARLLRNSDLAMYEAKEKGRNQYRIYGGKAKFSSD